MTSALKRGRTLDPNAVKQAQGHREQRLKYLLNTPVRKLTPKERREARRLTGRWDFWNHKRKETDVPI